MGGGAHHALADALDVPPTVRNPRVAPVIAIVLHTEGPTEMAENAKDVAGGLAPVQSQAWRAFLRGTAQVNEVVNRDLEDLAGLSLHEYEVLQRLSDAPERTMRMSALAAELVYSRSRLTHTVRRMEDSGLVSRSTCESDRRGVNCTITEHGMARLNQALPGHVSAVREHLVDRLTADQMDQLAAIMSALSDEGEETHVA